MLHQPQAVRVVRVGDDFADEVFRMSGEALHEKGRVIRFHPAFRPGGTNVDFVEVIAPGHIHVRTYERGVEAETQACGTGAVASAVISSLYADAGEPPIEVSMPGGVLTVAFTRRGDTFSDVWLSGEVTWVFRGEMIDRCERAE